MTENDTHKKIVELRKKGLSINQIAKEVGKAKSTVQGHIEREESKLGIKISVDPLLLKKDDIPGHKVVKNTISVDENGNIVHQWARLIPGVEEVEKWLVAMEERAKKTAPAKIVSPTKSNDLLLEFPIADLHMGQLSWGKETGSDYDCTIARNLLVNGFRSIIEETPVVGKIVISTLGDFYHADNKEGVTERSGNVLDTDSRFQKRVDEGIKALLECIEMAAKKAKEVDVIIVSGNHDMHSAVWLSRVIAARYHKSPQIKVHVEPTPRQYLVHGKVLLVYSHGHDIKSNKLASVIAAEKPKLWGESLFRYARVAHIHQRKVEEFPGLVVETIPTIVAPDAYAADHGFMSSRALVSYIWHKEYGLRTKIERCPAELMK